MLGKQYFYVILEYTVQKTYVNVCLLNTKNAFFSFIDYKGRITVPVLWDKEKKTIVNNESSEIIRMLNTEFNEFCKTQAQKQLDLYPESLRKDIDNVNEWIYP